MSKSSKILKWLKISRSLIRATLNFIFFLGKDEVNKIRLIPYWISNKRLFTNFQKLLEPLNAFHPWFKPLLHVIFLT